MNPYDLGLGAAAFGLLILGHALLSPYWRPRKRRQDEWEARNREDQARADQERHTWDHKL